MTATKTTSTKNKTKGYYNKDINTTTHSTHSTHTTAKRVNLTLEKSIKYNPKYETIKCY